jgi:hypothetical protein
MSSQFARRGRAIARPPSVCKVQRPGRTTQPQWPSSRIYVYHQIDDHSTAPPFIAYLEGQIPEFAFQEIWSGELVSGSVSDGITVNLHADGTGACQFTSLTSDFPLLVTSNADLPSPTTGLPYDSGQVTTRDGIGVPNGWCQIKLL